MMLEYLQLTVLLLNGYTKNVKNVELCVWRNHLTIGEPNETRRRLFIERAITDSCRRRSN